MDELKGQLINYYLLGRNGMKANFRSRMPKNVDEWCAMFIDVQN
jgi:hypothetical protein